MVRATIILVVDSALIAAAVLIVLLCIRAVFVSLRRGYIYFRGKKATVDDEPVGFWLAIISWCGMSVIFSKPILWWAQDLGLLQ